MKKRVFAVLMAATMVFSFVGCGSKAPDASATTETSSADAKADNADASDAGEPESDIKVAMVTDYGDITDQSFNQSTYEACQAFCDENKLGFTYYKPEGDSTAERVAQIDKAVADGYNVIVMPGYAFAEAIVETAEMYPDVKFVALDVSEFDLEGESSDFNSETYPNVFSAVYQEELPGYMAGYAAVKMGFTKLGFLGGMAVPAVIRYGYGFVQGANAAAEELGNTADVEVNYVYGGQFFGDEAITATMDTWYQGGTEIVFACGGGIFTSACEAAVKVDGKVIGVDVDQSGTIGSQYGVEGLCVTSAMKGLAATVDSTLTDLFDGNWSKHSGKVENLGIVSGDDPSLNYVQLPTDTWTMKNFTIDDYKALVSDMNSGKITVDSAIEAMPSTTIKVTEFDNIH